MHAFAISQPLEADFCQLGAHSSASFYLAAPSAAPPGSPLGPCAGWRSLGGVLGNAASCPRCLAPHASLRLTRVLSSLQAHDRRQGLQACLDLGSRSSSNGKHLAEHPEGQLKIPPAPSSATAAAACLGKPSVALVPPQVCPAANARALGTHLGFEERVPSRELEVRRLGGPGREPSPQVACSGPTLPRPGSLLLCSISSYVIVKENLPW